MSTRQNREGAEWRISLYYRALCGCPINSGQLFTGCLKDEQSRPCSTRKADLEGKVSASGNKFLPSLCWIHRVMSSSRGQIPSSRDTTSRDRVQPSGSWLQVLSTSTNAQRIQAPQPPKCVKPRVSLRRVSVPCQGKEAQENPEEGKAHPNPTLATRGNSQSSSSSPCCLCSPL